MFESTNIKSIFNTLKCKLNPLKREIKKQPRHFLFSDRFFRGKFCRVVREHSGYSRQELCRLLNTHPDIEVLRQRYTHFGTQCPFTPKFLKQFETKIETIMEYCRSGFSLGGLGFPTDELTRLIVEICKAKEEHHLFLSWCHERYEPYKLMSFDDASPFPIRRRLSLVSESNHA